MGKLNASQGMRQLLMTDYGHYARQDERAMLNAILLDPKFVLPQFAVAYDNRLLADQPNRSLKNHLICGVAILCRHAADLGADDKRCYALSDYYMREIDKVPDNDDWAGRSLEFYMDMARQFSALVTEGRQQNYSLPIARAVRFVRQHLYDRFTVADIARAVRVHPNYLSSRFRAEVGIQLRTYMRNVKMEEAKDLLQNTGHTIAEVSEMLGFCDVSYFTKVFHRVHGHTPRQTLGRHGGMR